MKKLLFVLAPLGLVLAGCTSYRVTTLDPVPVVTTTHAVVAAPIVDSDLDGIPDVSDRYPFDNRFR